MRETHDRAGASHDVFVSYARLDGSAFSARLEQALQDGGLRTWRDTRDLDPSQDFTAELERAIEGSRAVVVCVTAGTKRADSYVRREIGYASALAKPIVVALVDGTIPPISIVNLSRVPFDTLPFEDALAELRRGLARIRPRAGEPGEPFERYLHTLYRRIVGFLDQTVVRPVKLAVEGSPEEASAVRWHRSFDMLQPLFSGHGIEEPAAAPRTFATFREAFFAYGRRVLLLGGPGSGKTITLMTHARDAVAARLDDASFPVPLLGLVSTWQPSYGSLAQWLAEGFDDLEQEAVGRLIEGGNALLLLDGLDELPTPADQRGPDAPEGLRADFLRRLPATNDLVLTWRTGNSAELALGTAVHGTITLQPLDDAKLEEMLAAVPELLAATRGDRQLRDLLATPLIATLFARAYFDLDAASRRQLEALAESPGELRDTIIRRYVRERYLWESRRLARQGQTAPFTLEEVETHLGRLAMENAGTYRKNLGEPWSGRRSRIVPNLLLAEDFVIAMGDDAETVTRLLAFARTLQLLIARQDDTYSFPHLLVRDALAFDYSRTRLLEPALYGRWPEFANPAEALGRTGRARATAPLVALLESSEFPEQWHLGRFEAQNLRECAACGLGYTGDPQAVEPLIRAMKTGLSVDRSAHSLGRLGDPRALEPLIDVLRHGGKHARRGAAVGLGWLEDERAIPPLVEVLEADEDDGFLVVNVLHALCQVSPAGREALLTAVDRHLERDSFVSVQGALALLQYGDERVLDLLLERLQAGSPAVRGEAALALGPMAGRHLAGGTPIVAHLIEALADTDFTRGRGSERVCEKAAAALRTAGTDEAKAAVAAWEETQRAASPTPEPR